MSTMQDKLAIGSRVFRLKASCPFGQAPILGPFAGTVLKITKARKRCDNPIRVAWDNGHVSTKGIERCRLVTVARAAELGAKIPAGLCPACGEPLSLGSHDHPNAICPACGWEPTQ